LRRWTARAAHKDIPNVHGIMLLIWFRNKNIATPIDV
jgi:hypothetical protein